MSHINPVKKTKNERREEAREKAKLAREELLKKERKRRIIIQSSVVLSVVAILAIIGIVVAQAIKPAGPGPRNMLSGGVVFEGADFNVQETPGLEEGAALVAQPTNRAQAPIDVVVFVDYMCPHCGLFEQEAGAMLEQWVASGQATLQVYPLNFQDGYSQGTRYSTRAANAVACVVDQQPTAAWGLHASLLDANEQPKQNTAGLTDERLIELAVAAGATSNDELKTCIKQVKFGEFFTKTTKQALSGPLVGLAPGAQLSDGNGGLQDADGPQHITGTPTVLVNGQQAPTTVAELEQFMLKIFAEVAPAPEVEDAEAEEEE